MDAFVESTIKEIREKVGDGKVLLALSGGVDSSVAAGLLSRAIGKQLTCVFVDHGLLRKDEGDEVEGVFGENGQFDLNFIRVNAQQRYYDKLKGVTEPEAKRKIIGEEFIRIFEEEAKKDWCSRLLSTGNDLSRRRRKRIRWRISSHQIPPQRRRIARLRRFQRNHRTIT